MNANVSGGEKLAIGAVMSPQTVNSTPGVTGAIDMSVHRQATFVFTTADMANETLDVKVEQSADSGFTTPSDLRAATQRPASASANDNIQIVVAIRAEELAEGQRYVRGHAVTGGATGGLMSIVGLGHDSRHGPAALHNPASVVEVKR